MCSMGDSADADADADGLPQNNAMFSNSIDRLKESFLLATAQGGSAQDCESLLKLGADVNFRGADEETPLLGATRRGHYQAGSVLIVHGADCNMKGRDSLTPLHVAAKRGDLTMLNVLLDATADPSVKTSEGKTAFDLARSKGYEDICQRLLDYRNNQGGVPSSSFSSTSQVSRTSRAETSPEARQMYSDLEAVTIRSDRASSSNTSDYGSQNVEQKASSRSSRTPSSARNSGVQLIGDQYPAVAPPKMRPGSAAAARSIEEKRIAEAERTSKLSVSSSSSVSTSSSKTITTEKLTEHATRVYREEQQEAQMMDTTRALLDTEMKLQQAEERLQIAHDENAAQQIRMEEAMIENAVSGKEVESLKEQFFRMKEYLQEINDEMGLLRGEPDAVAEITSVGECERLEKVLKTTLSRVEERKSSLIADAMNKTSDEQKMCVVCIDEEKSVLLLPCRHVCVCKVCSRQLDTCPVCRAHIDDKINVFM